MDQGEIELEFGFAEALSQLRFIAKIKAGERVWVGGRAGPRVQDEGLSAGVRRWWAAEGRAATYEYLKKAIQGGLELAEKHRMAVRCLEESCQGIDALAQTYQNDRMYVSRLESLRDLVVAGVDRARAAALRAKAA